LYLTKKLGVGVVTTAQKRGLAKDEHMKEAKKSMLTLNSMGEIFGALPYVNALTDVTGFGLLGHLNEFCEAVGLSAVIDYSKVPVFDWAEYYISLGCVPGGTTRNWDSYGSHVGEVTDMQRAILADPQTSGGLLVSIDAGSEATFEALMGTYGHDVRPIGQVVDGGGPRIVVR